MSYYNIHQRNIMEIEVHKFGGASVNSAMAVENMASIVARVQSQSRAGKVIVVSAMGKTTNALERLIPGVCEPEMREPLLADVIEYHLQILRHLFRSPQAPVYGLIKQLFDGLRSEITAPAEGRDYNLLYDRVVPYGELLSTTIVSQYLMQQGIDCKWLDVREVITTNEQHRAALVDMEASGRNTKQLRTDLTEGKVVVTQGFIASAHDGSTTTLGREGSDYSAAVLAYLLDSKSVTIWKDVEGFLNADPKYFHNTVKVRQIPYSEAIELAYYGASIIHPKTVKPLQNKHIPLYIRSFVTPEREGSAVGEFDKIEPQTPLYIFKRNQVLVSVMPKDFSFIAEDNLEVIFAELARLNLKVNLMQNSALSFSFCVDYNEVLLKELIERLQERFVVKYNQEMELITIRYYTQEVIDSIVEGREIVVEQRSRITAQVLVAQWCS